jgi:hypothetical protein
MNALLYYAAMYWYQVAYIELQEITMPFVGSHLFMRVFLIPCVTPGSAAYVIMRA